MGRGYARFDQVTLVTTRNVSYLSASPEESPDPQGIWSVAGAIGQDLLLTKKQTVIRIPASDVRLVIRYDPAAVLNKLEELHGQGKTRGT